MQYNAVRRSTILVEEVFFLFTCPRCDLASQACKYLAINQMNVTHEEKLYCAVVALCGFCMCVQRLGLCPIPCARRENVLIVRASVVAEGFINADDSRGVPLVLQCIFYHQHHWEPGQEGELAKAHGAR